MTYADQMAAIGADADAAIAAKSQAKPTTTHHDAATATGQAADAALAAAAPPPPPKGSFAGDCQEGHIRWGISLPVSSGSPQYGSHRTYFQGQATDFDRALAQIKADHAKGIVPWVSFRPRTSWANGAGGDQDVYVSPFFTALAGLALPVLVTFGHEPVNVKGAPDDSGGAAAHLAWNKRQRGLLDKAGAGKTTSLVQNHMAGCYPSLNLEPWYADGVYHMLTVDAYQATSGDMSTQFALPKFFAFLKKHSLTKFGLGEWAVKPDNTAAGAANVSKSYDYLLGLPKTQGLHCVVADYWNSTVPGGTNWKLSATQTAAYNACAAKSSSIAAGAV